MIGIKPEPGLSRFLMIGMSALLSLSGCVSLLPDAPLPGPRYSLADTAVSVAPVGDPVGWSLSIDEATASRAVDTTKIALTKTAQEFQYYAGGEWTDRAPRLFVRTLIRSFENSGAITSVGARSAQPVADYILQTDIRRFEADGANGALTAQVDIYARITDLRGHILATRRFTQTIPVTEDNPKAVAAGLNAGSVSVINQIVTWSVVEGERLQGAR